MNQLNSLILEGTITKSAVLEDNKALFSISVSRYYKDTNGEAGETKSYFDVEVEGALAELHHTKLTEGRGVRIVGRLASKTVENETKVYVYAEHIEFKPSKVA